MKSTKLMGLFALGMAWSMMSCSNEIDVIGEWKEIPIIYGLLDAVNDSVTYVRVEKAYLPPDQSALEVAQIPDSLYYPEEDIDVVLYQRVSGEFVVVDTMERVDLALMGMPRDEGIFAEEVNYAYQTMINITRGSVYRIEVQNKVTGNNFGATTTVLNSASSDEFFITKPSPSLPIGLYSFNPFTNDYVDNTIATEWNKPPNAGIYDVRWFFRYTEFEVDPTQAGEPEIAGTAVCKEAEWVLSRNQVPDPTLQGSRVDVETTGSAFFTFLDNELSSVTGTNIRRCAVDIRITVDAGGDELAEYILSRRANTGIVGGLFPADPYTNIENGYGIFSSKQREEKVDYFLDTDVLEYMAIDEKTNDLGFRNFNCQCQ